MTLSLRLRRSFASLLFVAVSATVIGASRQEPVPLFDSAAGSGPSLLETDAVPDIVISPGFGSEVSRVLSGATLELLGAGFPFGAEFTGGVRTAAGDVSGDGVADLLFGMGPGGGLVTLLNGANVGLIGSGYPFGPDFGGGVNLALGHFNSDRRFDIVTAQASRGGTLVVFDGVTLAPILSLQPFGPGYGGGLNIAAGDFDGDGISDLMAGQADGGSVALINGRTRATAFASPYGPGGVFVAAGDVNNDGFADAMAAPGVGLGPVIAFDLHAGQLLAAFSPYTSGSGVRLAATDLNGDGRAEILTVPGPGAPAVLKVFDGATFANTAALTVYPGSFGNGAFVSAPAAQGLRFRSAATASFTVGTAGAFTVAVAGQPTATSIAVTGILPPGVTFTSNGSSTATLSGTPAAGAGGTYPLTFTAANGVTAAATQSFILTVNQAPQITSAGATEFHIGVAGTFSITSTGFPRPTVSIQGALPAGVTFTSDSNGTGTLSGTAGGPATAYPLTITASNSIGAIASQSFTLSVNDATPVFTSAASAAFTVGSPGTFTVSATATPSVTSITRSGSLPTGVSFTDNGNGTATLAGSPAASTGGNYVLQLTASNAHGSTLQTFTLAVNQAPAITSANNVTIPQGAPGAFSVTSTGFPLPTLTVAGALPPGVAFVDNGNGNGSFTGTPAAGSAGAYTLTLTATNGVGAPATQGFSLQVSAPPAVTSATATTFTVGSAGTFTITTSGGPTPATITRTGTLPSGVTFVDNGNGTATLAGTPTAGSGAAYPLTIFANNTTGPQAQQAFTLNVNQVPAITSATSAGFTVGVAGSFTVTASGFPTPTLSATGALPAGVTFVANGNGTATLSGTPGAGTSGGYPLTFGASNAAGSAPSQSFTLTINAAGPGGNDDTFSNGVGNTQYSVGAGTPATPAVVVSGSVLTNDTGAAPLSAGPGSIATTNGGSVVMSSNGAFLYTPAVGFAGPSDTFTYVVTDNDGQTDTAVVTINMTGVVWYVNAGAPAGDGRSQSPFSSMDVATAAAQVGQVVYVHAGAPAGVSTLKANQVLWGAGAPFTLNGLSIAAASTPVLGGTIVLANGVQVSSLSVNGNGAAAIAADGLTGVESLNGVAIVGGATGLNLTGLAGTFTMTGGSITGVVGTDVLVNGGTGTINVGATIINTAGRSVDVQNRTAGSVNLQAAIDDSGSGVFLSSNPGSTTSFTGGLQLSTDAFDAFTAINAGALAITQNNTSIVNSIVTTSGSALSVVNTAITAAGVSFRSISAGTNTPTAGIGILLQNTGTGGGLTVTGNGSQPLPSGGTIRFKSGADGSLASGNGIVLIDTRDVSLNWMQLHDFDNSAIVGRGVNGLSMTHLMIDGSSGTNASMLEGPIVLGSPTPSPANGVSGTVSIIDSIISGGVQHNLAIYNQSSSAALQLLGTGSVGDCAILTNSATTGGDGLVLQAEGTAVLTATVTRCRFRDNRNRAILATAHDLAALTIGISEAEILRYSQGIDGFVFVNSEDAAIAATVDASRFEDLTGAAVYVGQDPGNATAQSMLRASVTNNQVYQTLPSVSSGIIGRFSSSTGQAAQARLLVNNNLVVRTGSSEGISVSSPDGGSAPVYDVTITNNHVDQTDDVNGTVGIRVRADQPGGASLCASIAGNLSHHPSTLPGAGIVAQQGNGAIFGLERGVSTLGTPVGTVLDDNQHPVTEVSAMGTIGVLENGVCRLP